MKLDLLAAPGSEPVSLDDVKAHLRLRIDDDDDLLTGYISAARQHCERYLSQSFVSTQWRLRLEGFRPKRRRRRCVVSGAGWDGWGGCFVRFEDDSIVLPVAPVVSVDSIAYVDVAGATQTLDPSMYQVSPGSPGEIAPALWQFWPLTADVLDAVTIAFTAGHAAIPPCVPMAIKFLVAKYYEDREISEDVPRGVLSVLSSADHGSYD